ncbi:restriction endonuclease subunit S [Anaerotignum lactatifermentans]|uniref:restriction endonuclease subunit S n=1 Tax=Anaerotignum lactatifermentans TaxID=160404 RepID=UPI002673C0EA|nr:restriction endonuclease subunit S [Anaerotignum lactatifermentans]
MARLGDVATYINGYAFKPEDWSDIGLPIIRIQDLTGNSYQANRYNGEYAPKYEVNDGDVLISWSASLGIYVWHGEKAVLNQHIFKVVFDKEEVCKNFFVHQVESILERAVSEAHGATMKHLTKPVFDALPFYLPPMEEQRKIAAVLDKVSDLIAKRRQQLEKLDLLVKARFVEMFGDFRINSMKWHIASFDEIATIDGNMTTDYQKYADYPHIGIDSIEKDTGELKGYRTVAEDGVISGKYIFTPKHIIYSKIRPNLNKVALPDFEGVCSADAYPILPMDNKCNRIFLAYNMRSPYFLEYILQFCNRTNLPKVNRKEVCGFKTPLPPLELQNQFSDFVEQAEKTKTSVKTSLAKLEILKKALMQGYFG